MKKVLIFVVALTLFASASTVPALAGSVFPDVDDGEDYAEAVAYLREIGVMMGDDLGNFNPDKPVSRAEMAAVICRMFLREEDYLPAESFFTDVPAAFWGSSAIITAVRMGVVNGYPDGTFRPEQSVAYEEALTMLVRAMGLVEEARAFGGYPEGYINVACTYGYNNRLALEKGDPMLRWQVAVMVYNVLS